MDSSAAAIIETATAVDDLLRQLVAMDDRLLTDEQRLHLGELNEQITARLHAHTTRTLAGIDQTDAAKHVHGVCTTTWMRERHGYSGPEASGVLREAIRIVNAPVVWEGLAQARVSPRQTTAILTALKHLPPDLPPGQQTAAQQTMVDQAQRFGPSELRTLGDRLVEVVDPDHADTLLERRLEQQEAAARRNRELHLYGDGMGSTIIKGRVPAAEGEKLLAVLDAVLEKNATEDPPVLRRRDPGGAGGSGSGLHLPRL